MTASKKCLRQMGRYCFARYCRNLGMTFEETYFEIFGRMPREV